MHHAYLNIAQHTVYEIYSTYTLTHRVGMVWRAFFSFNSVLFSLHNDSPELVYALADFVWQLLWHFLSYSWHISTFSLKFKGFNIGQKLATKEYILVIEGTAPAIEEGWRQKPRQNVVVLEWGQD